MTDCGCPKCGNIYLMTRANDSQYQCEICRAVFTPEVTSNPPPDSTYLGVAMYNYETGKGESQSETLYYKDFKQYEHLPEATRGPIVKAEYGAYWKWHEAQGVLNV